jgi:hypothetical protein
MGLISNLGGRPGLGLHLFPVDQFDNMVLVPRSFLERVSKVTLKIYCTDEQHEVGDEANRLLAMSEIKE